MAKKKQLPLEDEAAQLLELRQDYETTKKAAEDAEESFKKAQAALFERMRASKVKSININDRNLVPAETEYSGINDLGEFVAWAEAEAPELIKVVADKEQLHKLVRQRLDDNEPLPPGVSFYVREYISNRAG